MSDPVYLYGFVPATAPTPPDTLRGVAERPLELLDAPTFRMVVSRVPAEDYAGERLESNAGELPWLAKQGVAHERVVAWFVDHAQILPVRLLTLYSTERALRDMVDEREARIVRELERFRGMREWDLKVTYDEEQLEHAIGSLAPEIGALDAEIAAAPPGRRYLLERKRATAARAAVGRTARHSASAALDALGELAADVRVLEPPRTVEGGLHALAAALLVRTENEAALRVRAQERATELGPSGIELRLSGPWAPYRFLEDPQ
ncbi:MAG: GvpL/GvpF family gas vesicle protein [Longimicrobiales bacterium]